ncbi:MAG: hypothetical protein R3Y40_00685 [Eubacteriales bacterium]
MREDRQAYIYGNTVRQTEPLRRSPEREPREIPNKKASQQVKRNRKRVESMDLSYVLFLTGTAMIIVFACVAYLNLQSTISARSSNITSLQREISDLSMENDAALDAIEDSVDLETIKIRAAALGMVYLENSQVVEYSSTTAEYVKQYEEIPESGILAYSDEVTE